MTFVKWIAGAAALGVALLLGSGPISSSAQAGYVVTFKEVGSDVVATGSGTLDVTDLKFIAVGPLRGLILPLIAGIVTGPAVNTSVDFYIGTITGPASFGISDLILASSGSGDIVGIQGTFDLLIVPEGYVSGNILSNTSTWLNETFLDLGVTPGTYVWTWGIDQHADSFTLVIGAVPEPASLALLGTALAVLLLARARRRIRHP
jgi:PEP-CTERM motif